MSSSLPLRKRPVLFLALGVAVLLIIAAALIASGFFRPYFGRQEAVRASHEGDAIVLAALQFHRDHGRAPASLDELVPQYLTIPPSSPIGTWTVTPHRPLDGGFAVALRPDHSRVRSEYDYLVCNVLPNRSNARWQTSPRAWYSEDSGTLRQITFDPAPPPPDAGAAMETPAGHGG
jgi:hypothetical protein